MGKAEAGPCPPGLLRKLILNLVCFPTILLYPARRLQSLSLFKSSQLSILRTGSLVWSLKSTPPMQCSLISSGPRRWLLNSSFPAIQLFWGPHLGDWHHHPISPLGWESGSHLDFSASINLSQQIFIEHIQGAWPCSWC